MIWFILIILAFLVSNVVVFILLRRKVAGGYTIIEYNQKIREEELAQKKEILSELAVLSLNYCTADELKAKQVELGEIEDTLRAQRGRLTITEAELEAVETRLRELEEIERELETSSIEAGRELEMIKAQERDFLERNEALKDELEKTGFSVELLKTEFSKDPALVQRLTEVRQELEQGETKISWFSEQITRVNQKYMVLKRAYDALDIEYAQLYEKHNTLLAASGQAQQT